MGPPGVLRRLSTNTDIEINEMSKPPQPDTSEEKVESIIDNSTVPNSGGVLGKRPVEKREQNFEIEDAKCQAVKFCENLKTNNKCGYCIQDDIEGNHPFHYGDENGPYLKRNGGMNSLCAKVVNGTNVNEWTPPSALSNKKQKELEDEESYIKQRYPNERDPRRIGALNDIQDKKNNLAVKDTGFSGCLRMRERYVCSKVDQCSPMNFTMFGIKAEDICGFCADDGKAYVRRDLPPSSKFYHKKEYVARPKCANIEIFGDGINCSSYNN